jgi:hypothetical protein
MVMMEAISMQIKAEEQDDMDKHAMALYGRKETGSSTNNHMTVANTILDKSKRFMVPSIDPKTPYLPAKTVMSNFNNSMMSNNVSRLDNYNDNTQQSRLGTTKT